VAVSTQFRDFLTIGFSPFIAGGIDDVCSVTIRAVGSIGILFEIGNSMAAFKIVFRGLSVTVGTVDLLDRLTRPVELWRDISMAFHAGDIGMGGVLDVFLLYF